MEDGRWKMNDGRCVKEAKENKDHNHACYTSYIISEHLKPQVIFMRRGSDKEENCTYQKNHYRFVRPSNKSIEMTSHPGSNVKEQEKSPCRYTQESQKNEAIVMANAKIGVQCLPILTITI